jgi:putative DNA-invertase from lambdoid prophage Rac
MSALTLKGGTYHRVSTVDQDPELARGELRVAAAARSCEIVMAEEETGSGAKNDRPGLQRIMEAARRGKINVVIVWKLDRFGRSALDVLSNIETLTKAGVRFIAITQGLDVSPSGDPVSKLILTVLAAVAEFERNLIRERTLLGLVAAKARGVKLGRRSIPEEDVVQIEKRWAQGWGAYAIAKELNLKESTVRTYCKRYAEKGGVRAPHKPK